MKRLGKDVLSLLKWSVLGIAVGTIVGAVTSGFGIGIHYATSFREGHTWIIWLLPLAGLLIVFMYQKTGHGNDRGTNSVIEAIREGKKVSIVQGLLVMVSTVLTHLFGGSTGREGAALQLGGSIGSFAARGLGLHQSNTNIIVMAGMSAAFSALFGTPLAAVFLPMEFVSVGVMYYAALVPCIFSSFLAHAAAVWLGAQTNHLVPYAVENVPELYSWAFPKTILLGIACALAGILFCWAIHLTHEYFPRWIPNPYVRVMAGGLAVAVLAFLLGHDYIGLGSGVIKAAFAAPAVPWAFLLKILFTCLTLSSGFKGGEIVPSFFVGATLGSFLGGLLGLPPNICAACGMCGVFCAVTNSPVTSLFIAFELFGFNGMGYFAIVIGTSYMLSDYVSFFSAQKILYSKTETKYINLISEESFHPGWGQKK